MKNNLNTPKETAHKISKGHYEYRGYKIYSVGYYEPEHRVCWECIGKDGTGFGHSYTKKACMLEIDLEIERNVK